MNDLSMPVRSTDRPGQEILDAVVDPDARISPLDRLSLRLGVWLLLHGARHARRPIDHDAVARLRFAQRLAQEREHAEAWAQLSRQSYL